MAATLTKDRFDDPAWLFEQKLDGIRGIALVLDEDVRMLTRNKLPIVNPSVADVLAAQPSSDFVLDGEMVAFVGERSGFGLRGDANARVEYHVFDVMRVDGRDVTELPLDERKRLLATRFAFEPPVVLVRPLELGGLAAYERACADGWEGVIAKRRDSVYEHRRSKAWLKMKCEATQELVVGGFTDPRGAREGLGALLVGYYDGDDFVFAGKVGTGLDTKLLRELRARFDESEIAAPPFTRGAGIPRKYAHWVRPEVVVQVAFTEWTSGDKLRHPHLLGVREDKTAKEVVRES